MAAASPASTSSLDADKIELLKDLLYDAALQRCAAVDNPSLGFRQEHLLDLGVISDRNVAVLSQVLQGLVYDQRSVVMQEQSRHGSGKEYQWRFRRLEDAQIYRSLPGDDERGVYHLIDEAGTDGIMRMTLRQRAGMQEPQMKKIMHYLESNGLVAEMKSVEHPNKKMYIKASLNPSARATGGAWYTDGEMDEAFIETLYEVVLMLIRDRSGEVIDGTANGAAGGTAANGKRKVPRKGVFNGRKRAKLNGQAADDSADAGSSATAADQHDDATSDTDSSCSEDPLTARKTLYPYPPGYTSYPTAREITKSIARYNLTNGAALTEENVQQLLNVLIWDRRIEAVPVRPAPNPATGYRIVRPTMQDMHEVELAKSVRTAKAQGRFVPEERSRSARGGDASIVAEYGRSNGLIEAPCGRCPVFDLCEKGGPVSPDNCVYFQRWLGLE